MTWKTLARKSNSVPEGWSTLEEISAELDCEPAEVPKILGAALTAGTVERKSFPYWVDGSRTLLYQTAFRQVPKTKNPTAPTAPSTAPGIPPELLPRVRALIARHPGKRPSQIADLIRSTRHPRLRAADIAPLMPS